MTEGSRCEIRLLGPLAVMRSDGEPAAFETQKVQALLAILVLSDSPGITREHVASMLWSRSGDKHARANLRQTLASLRKSLGPDAELIKRSGQRLALHSDRAWIDIDRISRLPSTDRPDAKELNNLLRGNLVEGLSLNEEPFDEWLREERARVDKTVQQSLTDVVDRLVGIGDLVDALGVAQRLLEIAPYDESAHRQVMRISDAQGDPARALRHFSELKSALTSELEIDPGPETTRLANEIRKRASSSDASEEGNERGRPDEVPSAETEVEGDLAPEIRNVVVLSGTFDADRSLGPDELHELLSPHRKTVVSIINDHGGEVVSSAGLSFQGLFGVSRAHSNDAERGIRAGLAILHHVAAAEPSGKAAVALAATSGPVVVGADVSERGQLPELIGEPLQRAHQLMLAAPRGGLLIDPSVSQSVEALFDLDASDEVDGSPAWLVTGEKETASAPSSKMIGRDGELELVKALLQSTNRNMQGEVVLIRGEAGIGKTRMVTEVAEAAVANDFEAHVLRVLDFGTARGQGVIAQIARAITPPGTYAPEESAADHPWANDPKARAVFLDLTESPIDDEARTILDAMDQTTRGVERSAMIRELLERACDERPLLLAFEDIHWASPDIIRFLAEIASITARFPILLVLSVRPQGDPIDASWRVLCQEAHVTTLDLAPLRKSAARELTAAVADLSEELAESCIERSQGNPLFLEQLARHANKHGPATLPPTVQSVVQESLDRLPAAVCEAIQAASVLGQQFTLESLRSLKDTGSITAGDLTATYLVAARGHQLAFVHALVSPGQPEDAWRCGLLQR